MQRQVQPKKEEKGGPLMQIKLGGAGTTTTASGGGGGGFKKGGFKNAFVPTRGDGVKVERRDEDEQAVVVGEGVEGRRVQPDEEDSDVTDDDDYYDPRRPTGCMPGCKGNAITSS